MIEVLTPIAACALFGKSAEAVRRAVAEGHVKSRFELRFGARPIRLLDLDSAMKYWHRSSQPSLRPIEDDLATMRFNSVVACAQLMRDGALEDDPLSCVRILHHTSLLTYTLLDNSPPQDIAFE